MEQTTRDDAWEINAQRLKKKNKVGKSIYLDGRLFRRRRRFGNSFKWKERRASKYFIFYFILKGKQS